MNSWQNYCINFKKKRSQLAFFKSIRIFALTNKADGFYKRVNNLTLGGSI
jgi:hypothetical protein